METILINCLNISLFEYTSQPQEFQAFGFWKFWADNLKFFILPETSNYIYNNIYIYILFSLKTKYIKFIIFHGKL